jgi:hypothetical protein
MIRTSCICGKILGPGRSTCGDSYCQEADFYRNMAQNTKKGPVRTAAYELAGEKADVAVEMARRRNR